MLPFRESCSLNHWFIKNVSFKFSTVTGIWDSLINNIWKELSAPPLKPIFWWWSFSCSWLFGKCILKCTVRFMDSEVLPCEQSCLLSFAENLAPPVICWLGFVIRMTPLPWRQQELGRFLSTHFCWSRNTWSRGSLLIWRAEVSFWEASYSQPTVSSKTDHPSAFNLQNTIWCRN